MRRETVRSGVFQPGHRLPTMSLKDYADQQVADAVERQEREKCVLSRQLAGGGKLATHHVTLSCTTGMPRKLRVDTTSSWKTAMKTART
jgi:hypothetical protein